MNLSTTFVVDHPLGASHMQLARMIEEFRAYLMANVGGRTTRPKELLKRTFSLQSVVIQHFVDEQADGYLRDALDVAPHLAHQVDLLQREHNMLTQELAQLVAIMQEHPARSWVSCRDQALRVMRMIEAHEAAEGELLESAYTEDLGNKD